MKRVLACVCALWVMAGATMPAHALKVTPFLVSFTPGAREDTQIFRVSNNSSEPTAVQISVQTWEVGPDGVEVNNDAEDFFIVFPAQLVLPPSESKAVRVRWLGPPDIAVEKPFRVVVEQVPVNLQETPTTAAGVRFLLRLKAALYVTPKDARGDLQAAHANVMDDVIQLTVKNGGTGHGIIRNPVLHMQLQDGSDIRLEGDVLASLEGVNIHAGGHRFFDLPRPQGLAGDVAAMRLEWGMGN